ncbi:uncharacterized protein LOC118488354 [Helianthus annuus]|uniref:uncharacterized protein LOC118488354 n=1 Tax=Helianthus annuus TaxID=4232 RepID=UPI001652BA01|nr:uncharacterized protein LOC118488354 [Helianthus annuus]
MTNRRKKKKKSTSDFANPNQHILQLLSISLSVFEGLSIHGTIHTTFVCHRTYSGSHHTFSDLRQGTRTQQFGDPFGDGPFKAVPSTDVFSVGFRLTGRFSQFQW